MKDTWNFTPVIVPYLSKYSDDKPCLSLFHIFVEGEMEQRKREKEGKGALSSEPRAVSPGADLVSQSHHGAGKEFSDTVCLKGL
jgi:hypothetical protein